MTLEQAISFCESKIQEAQKIAREGGRANQMNALRVLSFARRQKKQLLLLRDQIRIRGPIPSIAFGDEKDGTNPV